ncbi:MAG: hypothetical protein EBY32_20075, partial [Proteobacteria bacterium]|nr:hypothetical protein [Pseudomonadota bacterium]
MNETQANRNAAPLGARSQQITVNASPAQEPALAAFAGDRGISQGDALLLDATMTMNSDKPEQCPYRTTPDNKLHIDRKDKTEIEIFVGDRAYTYVDV